METVAVAPQLEVWETPEFDDVDVAPEVTMYLGQLD